MTKAQRFLASIRSAKRDEKKKDEPEYKIFKADNRRWYAQIKLDGKLQYHGPFNTDKGLKRYLKKYFDIGGQLDLLSSRNKVPQNVVRLTV